MSQSDSSTTKETTYLEDELESLHGSALLEIVSEKQIKFPLLKACIAQILAAKPIFLKSQQLSINDIFSFNLEPTTVAPRKDREEAARFMPSPKSDKLLRVAITALNNNEPVQGEDGAQPEHTYLFGVVASHQLFDLGSAKAFIQLLFNYYDLKAIRKNDKAQDLLQSTKLQRLNPKKYFDAINLPTNKQFSKHLPNGMLQKAMVAGYVLVRQLMFRYWVSPASIEVSNDHLAKIKTQLNPSPDTENRANNVTTNDALTAILLNVLGHAGLKTKRGDVHAQVTRDLRGVEGVNDELIAALSELGNPLDMMPMVVRHDSIEDMAKTIRDQRLKQSKEIASIGVREAYRRDYGVWSTMVLFCNYMITLTSWLGIKHIRLPEGYEIKGAIREHALRMPKLPGGSMQAVKTSHFVPQSDNTTALDYCFWPQQLVVAVGLAEKSQGLYRILDSKGQVVTLKRAKELQNRFYFGAGVLLLASLGVAAFGAVKTVSFVTRYTVG